MRARSTGGRRSGSRPRSRRSSRGRAASPAERTLLARFAPSPVELKRKVERTRRLRDKYRDLYKRQRLAVRDLTGTKRGNGGAANARTKEKAAIFEDLLARFQARYDRVTAPPKPAARKTPRKAVKKSGAARGPLRSVSPTAPAPMAATAGGPIGRAQGRRNQAKRDRR